MAKPKERVTIFVDYGGKALGKQLATNPVTLDEVSFSEAKSGDMDEQLIVAKYYLSNKDCVHAKEWAMKVFNKDNYYNGVDPVLNLLGIYEHTKQCIDHPDL